MDVRLDDNDEKLSVLGKVETKLESAVFRFHG